MKPGKEEYPEGFAEFWALYPRKDAKSDAAKAWKQVALHGDAELRTVVMAGLAKWKRHDQWVKDGGRYIPLPASWLRGRRWEDEGIAPARAAPAPNGQQWWQRAGFEHPAEAENARCHIGNAHLYRDGLLIGEAQES